MRTTEKDRKEAADTLRAMLPPGSTVHCILRHVSRSGMMRIIDLRQIDGEAIHWISRLAAKAACLGYSEAHEAVKMTGCGMDMGFAAVYELSARLYPDGFGCTGKDCPSNDHRNGDRDHTLGRNHRDGGYALLHRWI